MSKNRDDETRDAGDASRDIDQKAVREELAAQFFGVAPRSHQHSRKGQAESPRELNPNQPERNPDKNR